MSSGGSSNNTQEEWEAHHLFVPVVKKEKYEDLDREYENSSINIGQPTDPKVSDVISSRGRPMIANILTLVGFATASEQSYTLVFTGDPCDYVRGVILPLRDGDKVKLDKSKYSAIIITITNSNYDKLYILNRENSLLDKLRDKRLILILSKNHELKETRIGKVDRDNLSNFLKKFYGGNTSVNLNDLTNNNKELEKMAKPFTYTYIS
ncbi:hypothetical protein GFS03_04095 [Sulfolobus sp. E5-1-F]|uniref:type III-B CRISPR system CMR subunit Cmr7 n=1 Tax=Saccharolobus sp. E5-1-F TaxID=2663019 RepID=UPI001296DFB5|nr:type III-B CRISPR system CMR subunit Cmr7 [Sulfolobus sp. E5-1-F]QGA53821.1 hypothetical protein GFS03_04095 [Sulfolobus sp. E5-1-F]